MTTSGFVHLHVHTEYSLLDGAIRLEKLIQKTQSYGMSAVAMTDHGTMFGAISFYKKASKAGIKPIIGCEVYVAPKSRFNKDPDQSSGPYHLVLLARNIKGYQNLCKLVTIAQLEGFYYKPRIDKEILASLHEGLIGMSGCLHGEIAHLILIDRFDKAREVALFYQQLLGEGRFYLEVQSNGLKDQEKANQGLLELSKDLSIPLVATNDCHYLEPKDVRAHEILLCIQTGKNIHDENRFRFKTDQLYFKSPSEMQNTFVGFPGAIENTVEIAKHCNVELEFGKYHFPRFPIRPEEKTTERLKRDAEEGLKHRLKEIQERSKNKIIEDDYQKRLSYEIDIIQKMGFSGYFLVVADFIQYAKQKGIPVGPGRGSAAGSLVAYSLGITELDPIEHGLIFERFLNPGRQGMPDIDVDFCMDKREGVFRYVLEKYGGPEHVVQIITFGKLQARAVIRDVGRALNIPLREVDITAKLVPEVLKITIAQAVQQEPKLQAMAKENPSIQELLTIAQVLEGLPRHASTHAAGVVISDKPLVDYLPLYRGSKGEVMTQYDMKCVESIGLIKFDFLGLRTLTVIAHASNLIKERTGNAPDFARLDMNDKKTFEMLVSGKTMGVFQLESSGMRDLLVRMRPESFSDIVALVALYRPGPLESGMVDDFIKRKHKKVEVTYLLPKLEPILKETYGVILYQEQVMQIASSLANYSMAEADNLRKAMGKKVVEIMAQERARFLAGTINNEIDPGKATAIFDLMEKFGGYGFNKSHSAAYALIVYQTAYLKANYPVEFMAALLTSEMGNTDNVVKYITECRNQEIPVLQPDINESGKGFTIVDKSIRFGLAAVKNVGESAIESIVAARKVQGPFASIYDFCERADSRKVNKRVIESLIKCGAFDSTGSKRAQMTCVLEEALEIGQKRQKDKAIGQLNLFGSTKKSEKIRHNLPEIDEWNETQRLAFEKETLGFFVTGHPLEKYASILSSHTTADTSRLSDLTDGKHIVIGGVLSGTKTISDRKGNRMAFITLEDTYGSAEVTLFASVYAICAEYLQTDEALLVEGRISKDEKSIKILADSVVPLARAGELKACAVNFRIDASSVDRHRLEELREILARHSGACPAFIKLRMPQQMETVVALPDSLKVKPGKALSEEVDSYFGQEVVEIVFKTKQ
ncbi:MAG: DNA polymerase III subunit alpha [Pseudomonadota bacterium]